MLVKYKDRKGEARTTNIETPQDFDKWPQEKRESLINDYLKKINSPLVDRSLLIPEAVGAKIIKDLTQGTPSLGGLSIPRKISDVILKDPTKVHTTTKILNLDKFNEEDVEITNDKDGTPIPKNKA